MGLELPPEEGPPPAPAWIVTFTDMMSLLLTFFILLLTFTTSETDKFQQMSGSLSGAFGVGSKSTPPKPQVSRALALTNAAKDNMGEKSPPLRLDEIEQVVYKVQDPKVYKTKISIDEVIQGFRLRLEGIDGAEPYALGTSDLSDNMTEVLKELGKFFHKRDCRIVVECHVDSKTWRAGSFESAAAMTTEVAVKSAHVLEQAGIIPEHIGISPRGDAVPIVPNDSATNRAKNRRIEILLLPNAGDPLFDQKSPQ